MALTHAVRSLALYAPACLVLHVCRSCAAPSQFREDILPKVDPDALLPPNHFRTTLCYNEAVDSVLRAHEASLQVLFRALREPRGPAKKLLSFKSWSAFLRRMELIGVVTAARCATRARTSLHDPVMYRIPFWVPNLTQLVPLPLLVPLSTRNPTFTPPFSPSCPPYGRRT